jgi:hypothetical protein
VELARPDEPLGVNIIAVFGCIEITVTLPQPTLLIEQILQLIHAFERNRHRTKNGSKTKGRMIQTMGRAHAIKGFVADRPLAIEPIANPALAMKKISDTTLHNIIAAMIPPPESGPCGPAASMSIPKGPSKETKTT